MAGIEATAAIMLLVGFLGGVMAGIIVIVSVASRREDRYHSLTEEAPDLTCESTRRFIGVGVRGNRFYSSGPGWGDDGNEDTRRRGARR